METTRNQGNPCYNRPPSLQSKRLAEVHVMDEVVKEMIEKKRNLVLKFREFYFNLSYYEQKHLWRIMTALRGNDENPEFSSQEKCLTTARIRGEMFGVKSFNQGVGGYSYPSYSKVPPYAKRQAHVIKKRFDAEARSHFQSHARNAILALMFYRPKRAMRDLKKYIGTRGY